MSRHELPSLNSLRAFSILASNGSVQAAAAELNVTPAAISQHVKTLESHFELQLVIRSGRGIALTPEAQVLADELADGFGQIGRAVGAMRKDRESRSVQVTMSPAFAVEWLLPRIGGFQSLHPDITLLLNPTAQLVQFAPGGLDVAIRYQNHRPPEDAGSVVLKSDMIVVGTAQLINQVDRSDPDQLATLPWLQELGTREALGWLEAQGATLKVPPMISEMPGNLIMQAVRRGSGLTYTARAFFREEIAAGTMLVAQAPPVAGYYFIRVNPMAQRPSVRAFVRWLEKNAETVREP